jgi:hypothetical protein
MCNKPFKSSGSLMTLLNDEDSVPLVDVDVDVSENVEGEAPNIN